MLATSRERWLWIGAVIALALVMYYGPMLALGKPKLLFWADSPGYASQALSLLPGHTYTREGGRSVGYPIVLALALSTPWAGIAILAIQVVLVLAAFAALAQYLQASPRNNEFAQRPQLTMALACMLTICALSSEVHILAASVLPEIVFAVLALAAFLCVRAFCEIEAASSRLPWQVAGTLVAAFGNVLVKPHWLLVSVLLAAVVALKLALLLGRPIVSPFISLRVRALLGAGALAVCGLVWGLAVGIDSSLGATTNQASHYVFGPRSLFCSNAHLIAATVKAMPRLKLTDEPGVDAFLKSALRRWSDPSLPTWPRLGFNADSCFYDPELVAQMPALLPDPKAEGRVYLTSVMRAALANPLPFVGKIVSQLAYGFLSDFDVAKAGGLISLDSGDLRAFRAGAPERANLFSDVEADATVGPFANRASGKAALATQVAGGTLSVLMLVLEIAFVALAAISLPLAAWSWRSWAPARRQAFALSLALPLMMIFAHHLLVAITHSFDIWRYAFNMYFVSIAFVGGALTFWVQEWAALLPVRTGSEGKP